MARNIFRFLLCTVIRGFLRFAYRKVRTWNLKEGRQALYQLSYLEYLISYCPHLKHGNLSEKPRNISKFMLAVSRKTNLEIFLATTRTVLDIARNF